LLPWHAAAAIALPLPVWAIALVPHQPLPEPPLVPHRAFADALLPGLLSFAVLRAE
jgi:hypothetical protein